MSEEEAKEVIKNFLNGSSNIAQYLDALEVARETLEDNYTITELENWCNEKGE